MGELPGAVAHVDGTLRSPFSEAIATTSLTLWARYLSHVVAEGLRLRVGGRVPFVLLALGAAAAISPGLFNASARALCSVGSDGTSALGLVPTNDAIRDFLPAVLAAGGVAIVAFRRAAGGAGYPRRARS
jgi:hypothetical protein